MDPIKLKSQLLKHPNWKKIKNFINRHKLRLYLHLREKRNVKNPHNFLGYYNVSKKIIHVFLDKHTSLTELFTTIIHELAHFYGFKKKLNARLRNFNLNKIEQEDLFCWNKVIQKTGLEIDIVHLLTARTLDYCIHVKNISMTDAEFKYVWEKFYEEMQKKLSRQLLGKKIYGVEKVRKILRERNKTLKKRKFIDRKKKS